MKGTISCNLIGNSCRNVKIYYPGFNLEFVSNKSERKKTNLFYISRYFIKSIDYDFHVNITFFLNRELFKNFK